MKLDFDDLVWFYVLIYFVLHKVKHKFSWVFHNQSIKNMTIKVHCYLHKQRQKHRRDKKEIKKCK